MKDIFQIVDNKIGTDKVVSVSLLYKHCVIYKRLISHGTNMHVDVDLVVGDIWEHFKSIQNSTEGTDIDKYTVSIKEFNIHDEVSNKEPKTEYHKLMDIIINRLVARPIGHPIGFLTPGTVSSFPQQNPFTYNSPINRTDYPQRHLLYPQQALHNHSVEVENE